MESLTVILFLCVCVPVIPILILLPDKRSKQFLGFLLIGMAMCLISSEINPLILKLFDNNMYYVTTNVTPITEEVLKGLAILYFALFVSDDRDTLLSLSMAVGLGFALLENMVILTGNIKSVTAVWALARGLGAAQMHGACTALVGLGISYVRKKKKIFFCGTFSLLIEASIFHAVFNLLVQYKYRYLAFIWASLLFIPIIVITKRNSKKKKSGKKNANKKNTNKKEDSI